MDEARNNPHRHGSKPVQDEVSTRRLSMFPGDARSMTKQVVRTYINRRKDDATVDGTKSVEEMRTALMTDEAFLRSLTNDGQHALGNATLDQGEADKMIAEYKEADKIIAEGKVKPEPLLRKPEAVAGQAPMPQRPSPGRIVQVTTYWLGGMQLAVGIVTKVHDDGMTINAAVFNENGDMVLGGMQHLAYDERVPAPHAWRWPPRV